MVIPVKSHVEVAYLFPVSLRYVGVYNSNGSHNQLEEITDYNVEFSLPFQDPIMEYNSSNIEIISSNVFQLTIPQVKQSGTYTFTAGYSNT